MNVFSRLIEIFFFFAVFQAVMIIIFLTIQKKGNALSRKILISLLVVFIFFLSGTYLLLTKQEVIPYNYGHLANLTVFMSTPLLYFYFRSASSPVFRFELKHLLHVLPFVIVFSIMSFKILVLANHDFVFKPYGIGLLLLLFIQNLIYLLAIYNKQRPIIRKNGDGRKIQWFGFLLISFLTIYLLKLIIFIIWNIFGHVDICIWFTCVFFISTFVIVNAMLLYGLYKPEVLVNQVKYHYSTLDSTFKTNYYEKLQVLMENEKLYKDPLINLKKVAKHLAINEKQLSQLINENSGSNFNDYINQFRIADAMDYIKNSAHELSILGIAYEVGFNSKSTFNMAFKKFTGTTPSAYRKKMNS